MPISKEYIEHGASPSDPDYYVYEGTEQNDVITATGWECHFENVITIPVPILGDAGFSAPVEDAVKIRGWGGNDTITGADLNDKLYGDEGNDKLYGKEGSDSLFGGVGDDYLDGGVGDDKLEGGEGNDVLVGGTGFNVLRGGSGDDIYVVSSYSDVIIESEKQTFPDGIVVDWGVSNGHDTVKLVGEQFTLSKWVEDGYVGSERGNKGSTLIGNELDNKLTGYNGNDTLDGGDGDDTIDGGKGADKLIGGEGDDTFLVDNTGDMVVEAVDGGYDKVKSSVASYTIGDNVEWLQFTTAQDVSVTAHGSATANTIFGNSAGDFLFGEGGNDLLFGNDGDDYLFGGAGEDVTYGGEGRDYLAGHEGKDRLNGGAGNDTLLGGADNDELRGDEGDDQLWGEAGSDALYGGSGSDFFKYGKVADSAVAARDVIADFVVKADRIDLSAMDADTAKAGNQAFHFVAAKPFFATAGDLWIETTVTKTGATLQTVFGDVQGDGVADFAIAVQANATLTASDFIF